MRGAFSEYEENNQKQVTIDFAYSERATLCQSCIKQNETTSDDRDINIKDVNAKLKQLKINLY